MNLGIEAHCTCDCLQSLHVDQKGRCRICACQRFTLDSARLQRDMAAYVKAGAAAKVERP